MLADSSDIATFYDGVVAAGADPKLAANWVVGDILGHLRQQKVTLADIKLTPAALAELMLLITEGAISGKVRAC